MQIILITRERVFGVALFESKGLWNLEIIFFLN